MFIKWRFSLRLLLLSVALLAVVLATLAAVRERQRLDRVVVLEDEIAAIEKSMEYSEWEGPIEGYDPAPIVAELREEKNRLEKELKMLKRQ